MILKKKKIKKKNDRRIINNPENTKIKKIKLRKIIKIQKFYKIKIMAIKNLQIIPHISDITQFRDRFHQFDENYDIIEFDNVFSFIINVIEMLRDFLLNKTQEYYDFQVFHIFFTYLNFLRSKSNSSYTSTLSL